MSGFDDDFLKVPTPSDAAQAGVRLESDPSEFLDSISAMASADVQRPHAFAPTVSAPARVGGLAKPLVMPAPPGSLPRPPGAVVSGADEQGAAVVEYTKPNWAGRLGKSFAECEVPASAQSAGHHLLIIAVQPSGGQLGVDAESMGEFRAEIRKWAADLRGRSIDLSARMRAVSELDHVVNHLADMVLSAAAKSKTGLWTAPVPTGRQLVFVRSGILQSLGCDRIARLVHHKAVLQAKANDCPYNESALSEYERESGVRQRAESADPA